MKLLFCPKCNDVTKLLYRSRPCECGASSGRYLSDGWHAEVEGRGIILGLNNRELQTALNQREDQPNISCSFDAFIIPDSSPRIRRVKGNSYEVKSIAKHESVEDVFRKCGMWPIDSGEEESHAE